MSIIEIVITTVQGAPPETKTSSKLAPAEISVQDYAIHAIITAFQKLTVERAQLVVRHDYEA